MARRGRFEGGPLFRAKRKRIGEQTQGLALRRASLTALQRADPLHADPSALGESLL